MGTLASVSWIERITAPWTAVPDATTRIEHKLAELGDLMADQSTLLNDIAAGLSGPLAGSIQVLIAENAELRGEDAAESAAAQNVKSAFDSVASLFAAEPEAPAVEPLPEPETGPTTPETGPTPA